MGGTRGSPLSPMSPEANLGKSNQEQSTVKKIAIVGAGFMGLFLATDAALTATLDLEPGDAMPITRSIIDSYNDITLGEDFESIIKPLNENYHQTKEFLGSLTD